MYVLCDLNQTSADSTRDRQTDSLMCQKPANIQTYRKIKEMKGEKGLRIPLH